MSQIAIDKIYETDFYQWTMKQAQALKEQNVQELDWENLIEEIEALGRSDYQAVVSQSNFFKFCSLNAWDCSLVH